MSTNLPAEPSPESTSQGMSAQRGKWAGADERFDRTAPPERLKTLVDGVFAIVITLLVLDVKVPVDLTSGVGAWLAQNWIRLFSYAFSFFLIGFYWMNHHNTFMFVRKINSGQMWLNLIFLFCVGLMPFSTGLLSEHATDPLSPAIFALNLLVAGLVLYAIQRNLIVNPALGFDDGPNSMLMHRMLAVRVLAPTTAYVLIIIVSLLGFPIVSLFLFFLVPIAQYVLFRLLVLPQMQKRA